MSKFFATIESAYLQLWDQTSCVITHHVKEPVPWVSPELREDGGLLRRSDRPVRADRQSRRLWRDSSERLHQLATEPEDVTYREVTANGVPALWGDPGRPARPEHVPAAQPLRRFGGGLDVHGAQGRSGMWRRRSASRRAPHQLPAVAGGQVSRRRSTTSRPRTDGCSARGTTRRRDPPA